MPILSDPRGNHDPELEKNGAGGLDRFFGEARMARIPDQELERLKREVSLARLIEGQGHRLPKSGKDGHWIEVFSMP
jgi:hypothetical protein